MPRFVVRDQNDKQFGSFRFFWSSMCFPLQFEKPLNICFVLLGRRNDLLGDSIYCRPLGFLRSNLGDRLRMKTSAGSLKRALNFRTCSSVSFR